MTNFVYDEENRLETKDLEDDADVTYTYTLDGQVATIVVNGGTTAFDYDEEGRLSGRKDPNGPYLSGGNSIEYSYDAAGNISEVRTPAGVVSYAYDEQNRLKAVTEDGETTSYVYDAAGSLAETRFPNGVIERRSYDELNRLDVLETEKDGVLLSRFDYATNDAGHRLEVIESVRQPDGSLAERTVRYEYDDLYRLKSEEVVGEQTRSYTYDDVGNRLSQTVNGVTTTYRYDSNDRLLEEVVNGVVVGSYTYDNNGNTLSRTVNGVTTSYVWDDQNRMVQVQSPSGVVSYAYDDENIRVSETKGGVTTNYLLDKNRPYAQVLAEYEDGTEVASYTYGLDLIEQERNGGESYYLVDGLGSTKALTDESGNVTDSYVYDAYGNLVGSVGSTENDYRFAGEQWDGTLGQYYLRQRYYDPNSGRFTRRDTYEGNNLEPISLHKYIYANGNPVSFVDPSGLMASPSQLKVGNFVHDVIGIDFKVRDYDDREFDASWSRYTIAKLLKRLGRYTPNVTGNADRPDLIDFANSLLYEIKPDGEQIQGKLEIEKYLTIINIQLEPQDVRWQKGQASTYNPIPLIATGISVYQVDIPNSDGVIIYRDITRQFIVSAFAAYTVMKITEEILKQFSLASLVGAFA